MKSAVEAVQKAGEETAMAIGANEKEDDEDGARPPLAAPTQVWSRDDQYRLQRVVEKGRKAARNSEEQVCETFSHDSFEAAGRDLMCSPGCGRCKKARRVLYPSVLVKIGVLADAERETGPFGTPASYPRTSVYFRP